MVSVMQGRYNPGLYGYCNARKEVTVIYQDLPVHKDEAAAIEAMRFIGCDKMYILNDKKENITK